MGSVHSTLGFHMRLPLLGLLHLLNPRDLGVGITRCLISIVSTPEYPSGFSFRLSLNVSRFSLFSLFQQPVTSNFRIQKGNPNGNNCFR